MCIRDRTWLVKFLHGLIHAKTLLAKSDYKPRTTFLRIFQCNSLIYIIHSFQELEYDERGKNLSCRSGASISFLGLFRWRKDGLLRNGGKNLGNELAGAFDQYL